MNAWLLHYENANPRRYKQVVSLINRLLGKGHYEFKGEMEEGEYLFEQQGLKVPFPALSDGYRAFLGWISDLLYHVCETCPSGKNLIDNNGIVMVDEIDLHLHPEWQMNVLPTISKALHKASLFRNLGIQHKPAMKTSLAEKILERPDAKLIVDEVNQTLEAERRLRQQFYETVPEDQKAEFINGEIIVHSPVKKRHDTVSGNLFILLRTFVVKNQLGHVGHEKLMVSLTRNDYEPDICFFKKEKAAAFEEDQTIFPTPDLVVEVLSPGTRGRDYGVKLEDYEAHGILEYWIIDPKVHTLEQRILDKEQYVLIATLTLNDRLESQAIRGLSIPLRAIFEEQAHLQTLAEILQG